MPINREELLKSLSAVSPGLASREVVEQSSCFCFQNGEVMTFNDEIACRIACGLKITGAVPAKSFMDLIGKLNEPDLDFEVKDKELRVIGKGKRAGLLMESAVVLPFDTVEVPEEGSWRDLPGEFCEALEIVVQCTAADQGTFYLTCVHMHPDFLEACDNYQLARYPMTTGLKEECLVRGTTARHVVGLGMTRMAETASWLHFKNPTGLVLSCRRFRDDYRNLDAFVQVPADGGKVTLPGGLSEAVSKAEIFSNQNAEGNQILVELAPGKLRLKGVGTMGWYEERREIQYAGQPLSFFIAPKLLSSITTRSQDCIVSKSRLVVDAGKFKYVACLLAPKTAAV